MGAGENFNTLMYLITYLQSKVSSRSSSVQSLSDIQNDERRSSVTTPTAIPEEKPIP